MHKILVFSDYIDSYGSLLERLSGMGYSVVTAGSASCSETERLTTGPYDLVLMDISSGSDGDGVKKAEGLIRGTGGNPSVVYIVSPDDSDKISVAQASGATGYILKNAPDFQAVSIIETSIRLAASRNEILESEMKYRQIFYNISSAFSYFKIIRNKDGLLSNLEFTDVNEKFEEISGISKSDLVGRNLSDIDTGTFKEIAIELLNRASILAERDGDFCYESFVPGINRYFHISLYSPVVGYLVVLLEDVTENRQHLEEVEKKGNQFRDIVELANCMIIQTESKGLIVYANDNARKFLDYTGAEIVGLNSYEVLMSSDSGQMKKVKALYGEALKNREKDVIFDANALNSAGEKVWVRWYSRMIYSDSKMMTGVLCVGFDRTEQVIAEIGRESAFRLSEYRVKQLELISGLTLMIENREDIPVILKRITKRLPSVFNNPGKIIARIHYGGKKYMSSADNTPTVSISDDIIVEGKKNGSVEILHRHSAERIGEDPFFQGERELLHIIAEKLGRYITGRELESRLVENLHFLENLMEFMPFSIYITDMSGNYILTNNQFAFNIYGISKKEIAGKSIMELRKRYSSDDIERFHDECMTMIKQPDMDYKYRDEIWQREGNPDVNLSFYNKIFYDKSGKPGGQIGVIMDRTEEKKLENEVLNAYRNINYTMASIDSILIGVNIKDEIMIWNKKAEMIFELTGSEAIGRKITSFEINWDWFQIYAGISQSVMSNDIVYLDNMNYMSPSGRSYLLGISINAIKGDEEKFAGFLIHAADVTEKKKAEVEQMQAQKLQAIGQLAAGIAHEINTPVQYVSDNTHFIKESYDKFRPIYDLIKKVIDERDHTGQLAGFIDHMDDLYSKADGNYTLNEIPVAIDQCLEGLAHISRIVKSMRNFSYPEKADKTDVDINRAIQDVAVISRNEWKYSADLETDLDPGIPMIPGYPGDLNQVFLNMIINSVHAIEESINSGRYKKGRITIKTMSVDNGVQIEIEDNGDGIPDDIVGRIFEPFFTTKEVGKGTGQGLAIVHNVINEKHSGSVTVDSKKGEYTIFRIFLPYGT